MLRKQLTEEKRRREQQDAFYKDQVRAATPPAVVDDQHDVMPNVPTLLSERRPCYQMASLEGELELANMTGAANSSRQDVDPAAQGASLGEFDARDSAPNGKPAPPPISRPIISCY